MSVFVLNDAVIRIYEELELGSDGKTHGTDSFTSSKAKFLSNGVQKGDTVFIVGIGVCSVLANPTSETAIQLDKPILTSESLVFSVTREIKPFWYSTLAANYTINDPNLILTDATGFKGILPGTYNAFVDNEAFYYTHRDGNILKNITELGSHLKGGLIKQEKESGDMIFARTLNLNPRVTKEPIPQFRTSFKNKMITDKSIDIEIDGLLCDLEFAKRISNPEKSYTIQIVYAVQGSVPIEGFTILGCFLSDCKYGNQDNQESTHHVSYSGTFWE